jgi:hypothetical protein
VRLIQLHDDKMTMSKEDTHERRVQRAEEAINFVYADRCVGKQKTRESLECLAEFIAVLLDALKEKERR